MMLPHFITYSFIQYSYYEEKILDFIYYEHVHQLTVEKGESHLIFFYNWLLEQLFSDHREQFYEIPRGIITSVIRGLIRIIAKIQDEVTRELALAGDYIFSDFNPETPLLFELILLVKTNENTNETFLEEYENLWFSLVPSCVDEYFILSVKWE